MSANNDSLQTTPDSTLQKTQQQLQQQQISHISNLHHTASNNINSSNNSNTSNNNVSHHLAHNCTRTHNNSTTNSATSDTSSTSFHQRFDFSQLKARLPELNCLNSLQRYWQQHNGANDPNDPQSLNKNVDDDDGVDVGGGSGTSGISNSFYINNILGYTFGYQFGAGKNNTNNTKTEQIRETPLQKFYRHQQQKKMPAFRGKRGWCGCFQVISIIKLFL